MNKLFLSLLLTLFAAMASANDSIYARMVEELHENSLPLVNLTVDPTALSRSSFVDGEIEISDYHCRTRHDAVTVSYRCKLRIRGVTASSYDKKSFAVKLVDDDGKDLDANILGIREENSWILDAMAIDRTRMRNRVCFDIWNELSRTPYETRYDGRNGTEGIFVEVFINGDYHGLYCMTDKIDRSLLGLKKAKKVADGEVEIYGLLYKGINWDSGHNLLSYEQSNTDSSTWNAWELQYPEDYPSAITWQPLMDLIDFCSPSTSDYTFRQEYRDYFYDDNLLDYMIFTLALNVGDNAYKNTFLSVADITEGHCFLLTPWDMDMSLGGNWDGSYDDVLSDVNRYNHIAPFNRLYVQNIDSFADRLKSRWADYQHTLFSPERVNTILDHYGKSFITSGAWAREVSKWDGNPVPLSASVMDELEYVKSWYTRNHKHLCKELGTGSSIEIQESLCHSEFTVYTLDGRKLDAANLENLPKGIYISGGKKVVRK